MSVILFSNLTDRLARRTERLRRANYESFWIEIRFYLEFLRGNFAIKAIIDELFQSFPQLQSEFEKATTQRYPISGNNNLEHVALAYLLYSRWGDSENRDLWKSETMPYHMVAEHNLRIRYIESIFLEPLYDYIDEQLNSVRSITTLLLRYKQRTEWFHRERLSAVYSGAGNRAEKTLALDLYGYLHDQGLLFQIEPSSASGVPDLLSNHDAANSLVADVKIFDGTNRGKRYLINGFNQIYSYARDFNEPFGYLIIYKVCEQDLQFDVSGVDSALPYTVYNGKTIFFVVVDVFEYTESASKRGRAQSVVIQEQELVENISGDPTEE